MRKLKLFLDAKAANTPPRGISKASRVIFSVLALLLLSVGNVWAADVTTSWTATSGALGSGIGSGTINTTVSGTSTTQSWSYTRTLSSGASYTGWSSNCVQLGKNGGVENLTLSTSNIPGTIKSVSVECSSYQSKHNVSITVGETSYLASTATDSWTTVGAKSGTGTSSGTITISFTGGTRALYIKSITVVYNNDAPSTTTVSADPDEVEDVVAEGVTNQTIDLTYENISDYETEVSVHPNADGTGTLSPAWLTASVSDADDYATVTYSVSANEDAARTAYIKVYTTDGDKEATTIIPVSQLKYSAPTGTFEQFSGDIEEGDYLIVADGAGMNTTVSGNRLQYTALTLTGENYVNPDESVIWHIAESATEGYWTIYSGAESKYAAATGSNNQAQMLESGTDNKSLWSITHSEANYTITNKSNSRYLKKNGTYGFACYADGTVTLYKKQLPAHELTFGVASSGHGSLAASVGGSAINSGDQVAEGATVTLTPTADTYYQVSAVEVLDGNADAVTATENDGVYTFAMPASDATAEVSFAYIPVTSVSVDATLALVEGEESTLSATVLPATALGTVTWESDNDQVAEVDENTGYVVALGAGTAHITATSTIDNTKTATCTVTVSAPTGNPITITQNTGGTISANVSVADVLEGVSVTLTAELTDGYSISGWAIVGVEEEDLTISDDKLTCSFSMPDGEVLAEATFVHETAVLKLSANEQVTTFDSENTHYWKESITLPSTASKACDGKVFQGWDPDANCTSAPTYAPGAAYVIPNKGNNTIYAVYGEANGGSSVTNITYSDTENSGNLTGNNDAATFGLDATGWSVVGSKGSASNNVGVNKDGTIRLYYNAGGSNTLTITAPQTITSVEIEFVSGKANGWVKVGENTISPENGVYSINATSFVIGNANTSNVQVHMKNIAVTLAGEVTYSNYSTTCAAMPEVIIEPEEVSVSAAAVEDGLIDAVYENVNESAITVTLYDDAACETTFSGNWLTASLDGDKNIAYTIAANNSYTEARTAYIKLTAPQTTGATDPEVVVIPVTQAKKAAVFTSVSEFITYVTENEVTSLNDVTITGVVTEIVTEYSSQYYNVSFNIADDFDENSAQLQGYRTKDGSATAAATVAAGDQVTLKGNYTLDGTTHKLAANNTIEAYTAKVLSSVTISGTANKTNYSAEDNVFSFAGLTATAAYSNTGYSADVTADATWKAAGEASYEVAASGDVNVTATYGGLTSDPVVVAVTFTTKTIASISLSYASTYTFVGFDLPTPTVTASYVEDIADEDITDLVAAANGFDTESAYNKDVADTYTIKVAYAEKEAEYTVEVRAKYNNEDAPHTVADATAIINHEGSSSESDYMWVRGIVVGFNGNSNNNYYISDDGTTTGQLYVYKGSYFGGATMTADNKPAAGDVVILKTKMQIFNSVNELSSSQVVYQLQNALPNIAIANVAELEVGQADLDMTELITKDGNGDVTLVSGNNDKLTVDGLVLHAVAEGDVTVTANLAATDNDGSVNYKANNTTFNVHVIAARPRYAVTFDADGGTGTDPVIANQLPGAPVELPENPYSKENHAFAGWVVNDGAVEITDGHFTMPAAAVTVKATWNKVATCAISFMVNGAEVATANAPQTAEFSLAGVSHPTVPGFTWVGWSETEYAEEVEDAPATITSYTPAAEEATKVLYGIYSRLDNSSASYGKYVKATVVAEGDYLIVCENQNVAMDGSLSTLDAARNNKAVTISDGVLTLENADNYVFTIAAKQDGYSIKSASNMYIGQGSDANGLTPAATDNYTNSISITGGNVDISCSSAHLRYNKTSGQERFRYFKSTSYSGQTAIQLYKKDNGVTKYTSSPVEKVTITFDANGGEGGCAKAIINKGSELTICENVPTKSHSEFAGWKNGDDEYVAGQAYTFDADITLTAQWNDAATYDVTFDKNEGTGTAETIEDQYAGDEITLPAALEKDGFTFQGWKYGSKLYKAGASFTMPAEAVTFVAQWRKASVPVDKMSMVTSASALSNGMQIALGCSYGENSFAMAGDITGNNKYMSSATENVSLIDGVATYTDAVVVMTLEQVKNGWKITKDGMNYLKETSAKNLAWVTEGATVWTISFNGNNVLIEGDYATMKFNAQDPRFTTYASGQKDIQLFGKAVVVTEDASISDLGYVEGENIIADGNITLTIDEQTNAQSITAKNGATVEVNQPTTAESVVVEDGSRIEANAPTTTPTVYFSTTMGAADNNGDFHSTTTELGSVTNITLATGGEIIYDLTLGTNKDGVQADPNQWHAFSLPFAVDAINGVYDAETGAKLTNEVNYAIMDYHGDIRAQGKYGWKKYRGIMQPGVFYLMTVDGNTKTFRFKASVTGVMTQINSMSATAYDGAGEESDKGWNGFGNPRWIGGTFAHNAQYLDPYSYEYITITPGTRIPVGLPFFYKAATTSDVSMGEVGASYAPARYRAYEIKNVAVRFGNEVFKDKLYISASEDALNEYEQDKDLVKMCMSQTPKVARISGNAYGMKLSMVNAPMVNDQAEYSLTLYAPEAGEYTISAPAMEDADLYLTKDGAIIWNLSTSEYTTDFTKGNNEGYGLMLIKKAPGAATGTENIEAAEAGAQKVVINNNVYILRNEQMYDVTGKAVK